MKIRTKDGRGLILQGDCLAHMYKMDDDSVDFVFGSPPYEDQRKYAELEFKLKGQAWVDWMVEVFMEAVRISKGMVALVVGTGKVKDRSWSGTPALLCADLLRKGVCLRDPKIYYRRGIPGSGGGDDLAMLFEWIVCATKGGKLPWSDPLAMGKPWKYPPKGKTVGRDKDGKRQVMVYHTTGKGSGDGDVHTKKVKRSIPDKANPGNVIQCVVGSGHLGSSIAHEGEAPFPEELATFFIKTYCPPDGTVYDPFGGTGTTAAMAIKHGRKFITSEMRSSQIDLIRRRIKQANLRKGFGFK